MRRVCYWTFSAVLLLVCASNVAAHHNTGAFFDLKTEVSFEGTVTRYEFKNPHIYFYVETTNDNGEKVEWRIEAGPTGIMRRIGWTRDSLVPGQKVTFTGSPSRNPEKMSAFLKAVATEDGPLPSFRGEDTIDLLQSDSAAEVRTDNSLAGTWATLLDVEAVGPFDEPEQMALTPAGEASVSSFVETTMHPGLSCTPFTAPIMMLTPDYKSIAVSDEKIVIRGEFDNGVRTIYLATDVERPTQPAHHGFSSGRWEGQKLIVETSMFAENRSGNAFSLASGKQKSLHEEFEPDADGKSITYRFELRDPEYLAEPVSGEVQWVNRPDVEYLALECDLENSRLFLDE